MPIFLPKWYLPYNRFFDKLDPPEELNTLIYYRIFILLVLGVCSI